MDQFPSKVCALSYCGTITNLCKRIFERSRFDDNDFNNNINDYEIHELTVPGQVPVDYI